MEPLIFLISINDFSKASELLFATRFADDTNMFLEGINYNKNYIRNKYRALQN